MGISTGVELTASTEDFESKIDKAGKAVAKTLSKSQIAIDMAIDSMGRYVNANGKCVEGLTLAQVKMGQYVDEQARVRTSNDGFVADLTKIEQALGFYADAHGDVFDAQNNLIRKTKEAQKAAEDEAKAAEVAQKALAEQAKAAEQDSKARRDELAKLGSAFSAAMGQFSIFIAVLDQGGETSQQIGRALKGVSEAVSTAGASVKTTMEFVSAFEAVLKRGSATLNGISAANKAVAVSNAAVGTSSKVAAAGLTTVNAASKATAIGLKALQLASGPIGIALVAVTSGIAALMSTFGKSSQKEVPELSDSFKTLEERAKRAGDTIKTLGDALKYGAFYDAGNKIDESGKKFVAAKKALDEATKKNNDAELRRKATQESIRYGGMGAGGTHAVKIEANPVSKEQMAELENAYKESMAEYNAVIEDLVNKAREEQKTTTDHLNEERTLYLTVKKRAEEQLKNAETDEERRKAEQDVALITNQIKSINGKIADEKKREQEAAQKALLDELGIGQYLNKQKSDAEDLQKAQERWKDAVEKNAITSEQYQEAMQNALAKRLGISFEDSKPVDPFEELEKYKDELGDAYQIGLEQLQKKFADELERSSATLDDWNEALKARKVSQEDFNKAAEKIKEATLSQYGVVQNDAILRAQEEYEKTIKAASEAYRAGTLAESEYQETLANAKMKLAVEREPNDAITQFSEGKAALQKMLDSHQLSQLEYDSAMSQLSARVKEMFPAEEKTALQTAQEEYAKTIKMAKDAFEAGALTESERQEAVAKAEKRLAEAKDAEAKAARDSIRSTLGVDQLMETLKSPLEKYRETMDKIDQAVAQNAVSSEESAALIAKAEDDYWAAMKETNDAMSKVQDAAGKIGAANKTELGKSMSSGSEELYLAQVRNSNSNYQSRMQNSVEGMGGVLRENLVQTQLMAGYLQTMAESPAPVFG